VYLRLSWHIVIGDYKLTMLDSVEIYKSVELLADTCTIKLPAKVNNKPITQESSNQIGDEVKGKLKRGDKVKVWLGYNKEVFNDNDPSEFEGYLLSISTDGGSIVINCEDDLFLMRKPVKDKEFKNTNVKQIAEYLISELKLTMKVNCPSPLTYDKFVIDKKTAYEVLKQLQDETKGNIYIKKDDKGNGVLNIHLSYIEPHGYVNYSFQQNVEESSLKYKTKEDRKVLIIIERPGKDGKTIKETYGTPGGEQETIKGNGLGTASLKQKAKNRYDQLCFDGFEGDITTWLIPYVEPGYSANIEDEDYPYKDGIYYVKAVTTSMDGSGGGARKVQLGQKLK